MNTAESLEVTPESPWLGLHSFGETTQKYFFGRDDELRELFRRVEHKTLTIIYGTSGLGKTSLLQAGLAPRLKEAGYLPVIFRLGYTKEDPPLGRQVIDGWRAALQSAGRHDLAGFTTESISFWELFHDPSHGMIRADGSPVVRPVLIFDQFEEVYTCGEQRRADTESFREALAELVENRPPESLHQRIQHDPDLMDRVVFEEVGCKVLLSLREDFLSQLERWRSVMPSLIDNRLELRLLSGPKAVMAVYRPGALRPEKPPIVTSETAAAIVRFVAGVPGGVPLSEIDAVPPLLSLMCAEMNAQRIAGGQEQISAEQLSGRSEDILEKFYNGRFASAPAGLREFVEDRLLSADGYRERLALDTALGALQEDGVERKSVEEAIARLVDERLLVAEEQSGVRRIELTHDILTGVARRSRDKRRERETLEKVERERSEAEKKAAEQRRLARRARMVGALFVVLFAASLAAFLWAFISQQTAQAMSEKLRQQLRQASWTSFNEAEQLFGLGEWRKGIAHLGRAVTFDPQNPMPAERLFEELTIHRDKAQPPILANLQHQGPVNTVAFSPTGSRILTASSDNTAKLWDAVSGKLLATFEHQDRVNTAVFSPDGSCVLTASSDKTAKLWATLPSKLLATFEHRDAVKTAVFSPNGSRVLTASSDNTAKLWDAVSGKLLATFEHQDAINTAVFNPKGSCVLTASSDNTAKLWDVSGKLLATFEHQDAVKTAVFSPDGSRILTASGDKTAKLWSAGSDKPLASFEHQDVVSTAVFSPDGSRILTASYDKTAKLWSAVSDRPLASFEHQNSVLSAVFSPDGSRILTASSDKTAKLWDALSGKLLASFEHQNSVLSAVFSPDDSGILTASSDETAKLWNAVSGKLLASFEHQDKVNTAVFSPNGFRILTASSDKTAKLWNAVSGKLLASFEHQDRVNTAVFSPNGSRVLTASSDKTAKLWDAVSGELLATFEHQDAVKAAVFSPNGSRILTASSDNTAKLWDALSGELLATLEHRDAVKTALFSPDSSRVLTASSDKIANNSDAVPGKRLAPFDQDKVNTAVFSPNGSRILTASSDKTAKLWDAVSGKLLASFEHQDRINTAVFSPNGSRVLTASSDKTAKLWDAASGERLATLEHKDAVKAAVFSPNGSRVLTASSDKTAKLWDALSGKLLHSFEHQDAVKIAMFSPKGSSILSVSYDKTAKLWDAVSGNLLASFEHQSPVDTAVFSPDGSRILTTSDDKTAKLWDAMSGKLLGSFEHQSVVNTAAFSTDCSRILTASYDKTAKLWDIATSRDIARDIQMYSIRESDAASRLGSHSSPVWQAEAISEIASGLRVTEEGSLVPLEDERRSELMGALVPVTKGVSAQARFLRWFCASGGERTIFPGVETTTAEWVDNSLLTHREVQEEFLVDAVALLPSHGLLHVALAMYSTNKVSADFLRDFGLARLPQKNGVCLRAAQFLLEQERPEFALLTIDTAIRVDPQSLASRRLRVDCLKRLNRQTDELAEYQEILKRPEATASDFGQACYLAACLGQGNEADPIFADGEKRFTRDGDLMRFRGWALLNLGRETAAASAFDLAEQFQSQGQRPGANLLAGQAASRWAAGDQTKAVETYRTLIGTYQTIHEFDWANSASVQKLDDCTALEKRLLLAVLQKTLELHPELTPHPVPPLLRLFLRDIWDVDSERKIQNSKPFPSTVAP